MPRQLLFTRHRMVKWNSWSTQPRNQTLLLLLFSLYLEACSHLIETVNIESPCLTAFYKYIFHKLSFLKQSKLIAMPMSYANEFHKPIMHCAEMLSFVYSKTSSQFLWSLLILVLKEKLLPVYSLYALHFYMHWLNLHSVTFSSSYESQRYLSPLVILIAFFCTFPTSIASFFFQM